MIRRARRQTQPTTPIDPQIDARFGELMDMTARIVSRLQDEKPSDSDYEQFHGELTETRLGWTSLAEKGQFPEISKPYAEAMSSIVTGFDTRQSSLVNDGLATILRVADEVTKRNR